MSHGIPGHNIHEKAIDPATKELSVGQLVADRPSRARVMERYGIDYCCGGKLTLEEACKRKGIDSQKILEELLVVDQEKSSNQEPDWATVSLKELIDHIVTTYHQPLREELPRLTQLADKVAKVHGDSHPEMIEVLTIFKRFREQMELHMQKEEMILFPGIANLEMSSAPKSFGCGGGIEHPIAVMTQEHDDAAEAINAMRTLSNSYTPPADACNTFRALLHSLAQLESDMHKHVHKENNILFPRALAIAKPTQPCL